MANPLDFLLPGPDAPRSEWVWAVVTSVTPLRIQIDGDTAPLVGAPRSLIKPANLHVGGRVRVELARTSSGTQPIIHGPSDLESSAVTYTTTGRVVISLGDSTDNEPSYRLSRNGGTQMGRTYLTSSGGHAAVGIEAGDRVAGPYWRWYFRADGSARSYSPDSITRHMPFASYDERVTVTGLAQNVTTQQAVTFPVGVFTKTPTVVMSPDTSAPHVVAVSPDNISASGCNINIRRTDTTATTTVHVIAYQLQP
ncbi:MAG: hypothetical protein IPJ61_17555 [Tessaracoccus sp.]|uniref:hypothetical protein n=1 Tax=Tessaracoccus sp. TaxID=1971211 RepID=UPI001ED21E71|nr:hypothetical protein [Tessaracoccus sp.]MBK7822813.1 hypothetical protein [Tessaracoccus sp.]